MSNAFDQADQELTQFLDTQFSNPQPAEQAVEEKETDEDISQYLQADDEPQGETDHVVSPEPVVTQEQPAAQPVQNPQQDIIRLERELAAVRTKADMYERALQSQYQQQQYQPEPQYLPNVAFGDEELQVDESYIEKYNDADPYIQSIARRVANELYDRAVVPLQQELYNVRGQLESQAQFNHNQRTDSLHLQLKSVVPDIDAIAQSPEWQSYIRRPDYYGSGRTIQSYVQEGIQTGNVRQLANIINQFKATQNKGKPQAHQVAPGRAQGTVPNTKPSPRGGMLKMSEFERAGAAMRAGKLSYDKYEQIVAEFNQAFIEGRVNMNK